MPPAQEYFLHALSQPRPMKCESSAAALAVPSSHVRQVSWLPFSFFYLSSFGTCRCMACAGRALPISCPSVTAGMGAYRLWRWSWASRGRIPSPHKVAPSPRLGGQRCTAGTTCPTTFQHCRWTSGQDRGRKQVAAHSPHAMRHVQGSAGALNLMDCAACRCGICRLSHSPGERSANTCRHLNSKESRGRLCYRSTAKN